MIKIFVLITEKYIRGIHTHFQYFPFRTKKTFLLKFRNFPNLRTFVWLFFNEKSSSDKLVSEGRQVPELKISGLKQRYKICTES